MLKHALLKTHTLLLVQHQHMTDYTKQKHDIAKFQQAGVCACQYNLNYYRGTGETYEWTLHAI